MLKHRIIELLKYVINGVIATVVHYGVLTFNLKVIEISSAGVANLIAASFGIATSFLGNYYFVFQRKKYGMLSRAIKFSTLYFVIALFHGFILFIWSDCFSLDYRIGFIIATFIQFVFSYIGNKKMVF